MSSESSKIRIGAVAYLNTRPLVLGMEQGLGDDRIDLSYAVPADLAVQMAAGQLDIALLPVIELARIPELEIVPGLGIVTQGASRSVLLIGRKPIDQVRSVALDGESRSSNALTRVLFGECWHGTPEFVDLGGARPDLQTALAQCDAAVRIGDKALFDPVPDDCHVYDLGSVWTEFTGLPFVFAAWIARAGTLDRATYKTLHESHRVGSRSINMIAEDYAWKDNRNPATPGSPRREEVARQYLNDNIRYRLGTPEVRAIKLFLTFAERHGVIERAPEVRLALSKTDTECHAVAQARRAPVNDTLKISKT